MDAVTVPSEIVLGAWGIESVIDLADAFTIPVISPELDTTTVVRGCEPEEAKVMFPVAEAFILPVTVAVNVDPLFGPSIEIEPPAPVPVELAMRSPST